jgi:hypothetical protein
MDCGDLGVIKQAADTKDRSYANPGRFANLCLYSASAAGEHELVAE